MIGEFIANDLEEDFKTPVCVIDEEKLGKTTINYILHLSANMKIYPCDKL